MTQRQPYRHHIPVTKSSSSCDSNKSSDLFREAEDFIKEKVNRLLDDQNQAYLRGKMNDLLGIGYQCGQATKKTARRAFNDDDDTYESSEGDVD
eukprot:CAMPEP_0204637210 /NCGR_PEP_ID=MMETSP0717-20131115/35901_1 /ASSEMBLY_ACC=CAM_ASM_000666 /TAXON_ID=230516 /ORGANISM="Chaetoceros curvisetus" /LENGTH=93 /DNA_ID=CAMNT_0051656531 /DNA_START=37 /DNA_END=315 /DNA_ORIENTATION=-